jgi:hypothetical protein
MSEDLQWDLWFQYLLVISHTLLLTAQVLLLVSQVVYLQQMVMQQLLITTGTTLADLQHSLRTLHSLAKEVEIQYLDSLVVSQLVSLQVS